MNLNYSLTKLLIIALTTILSFQLKAQCPCVPAGWTFTHEVEIDNSSNSNALSNYQVLVVFDTQTPIGSSEMQANGEDIRFTRNCGPFLDYYIESGINTANTRIWVEVDNIPANSLDTIFIHYGNNAAVAATNGDNTFDLFDHFDGGSLDLTKWTATNIGNSQAGSVLTLDNPTGNGGISSNTTFTPTAGITFAATYFGNFNVFAGSDNFSVLGFSPDVNPYNQRIGIFGYDFSFGPVPFEGSNLFTSGGNCGSTYPPYNTSDHTFTTIINEEFQLDGVPNPFCGTDILTPIRAAISTNFVGTDLDVDWMYVRKYSSPEPSNSVGAQLAPYTILIDTDSTVVTCNGGNDGTATANPSNGTSPYTYLWDANAGNQTTQIATGLAAGSYDVTVTDFLGCTASATAIVTEPAATTINFNIVDASCPNVCNGSATANPTGGTSPYQYLWSNTQTTQTATNLCGDSTYYVTVTDANLCTTLDSVLISNTSDLAITISGSNATCFDTCNGTATVTPTGGTTPYSYNWSNTETTQTVTGLCADTFFVTVTDGLGCTLTDSIIITEPTQLTTTASGTDVNCFGECDGTANVVPSGGTPPYFFQWDDPNTQISQTAGALCADTFHVTVTDDNGCMAFDTVIISQPTELIAVVDTVDALCVDSCNGSATANVSGGVTPYTYEWFDSQTTQTATGLCAGSYSVTVTDANNCTVIDVFTINQPAPITFTFIDTSVTCNGGSNGIIDMENTGGAPPLQFDWSNGGTDEDISGLNAGTYTVTITDSNGCTAIDSVDVDEPTLVTAATDSIPVTCAGFSDGSATVIASGGIPPYTYNWSNAETTVTIANLVAGQYFVTVTDDNGCTAEDSVIVTEPLPLAISDSVTDSRCFSNCTGNIDITVTGGTTPYTFLWSNDSTTEDLTDLCAGAYSVTITDANGCVIDSSYTVDGPIDAIVIDSIITVTELCDSSNGSATVFVSGGGGIYTYQWNDVDSQTTAIASGLEAGSYIITAIDSGGCTVIDSVTIDSIDAAQVEILVIDATCEGEEDGIVDVEVYEGVLPYSIVWSTGDTTEDLTGVRDSVYMITVTDGTGCVYTDTLTVGVQNEDCISIPTGFTPNGDGTNDTWVIRDIEFYANPQIQIFNRWGGLVFESNGYAEPWDGTGLKGGELPNAAYYYVIKLDDSTVRKGVVSIIR